MSATDVEPESFVGAGGSMSAERWVQIPGYEGLYEISDQGRVRSVDRDVVYADGRTQRHRGKVLSTWFNPRGVLVAGISSVMIENGRQRSYRKPLTIHLLVAALFVPNTRGYRWVEFVNGDLRDARAENLRWSEERWVRKLSSV